MLVEVPAGGLGAGRIEPLDLREAGAGGLEVGDVDGAGLVVVREVAEPPPVRRDLDGGEGRVGQARDPRAGPLLGHAAGGREREGERREQERAGRRRAHAEQYGGARPGDNAQKLIREEQGVDGSDRPRRLASLRFGEGPRPLVLLHGFIGQARNLATLARRLADAGLAVLALDLTGHGASPPLPPGADLTTLARDVLATAQTLGAGGPLRLVGHSLGGRVALRACLLDAAAVAHVTLLDIGPSPLAGGDHEVSRLLAVLATAPAEAGSREPFRAHLRAGGLAPALVEWLLLDLETDAGGYRWRIDREALAALHRRTSAEDLWAAVQGPRAYGLRCVRGGRSRYVSDADARRLEAAGCPVATLEGAGHFVHADRPAELAALLLADLA